MGGGGEFRPFVGVIKIQASLALRPYVARQILRLSVLVCLFSADWRRGHTAVVLMLDILPVTFFF